MTMFKIGDTVRLPLEKPDTFMVNPGWTENMNRYLGKVTKIVKCTHNHMCIVDVDRGYYYWHPAWCTLESETVPEKPINKVLARSLKLERAFKEHQKNKKTIKPTVISIDRYPLSF